MLILRKLVESSAVNAVCVLQLEDGHSVVLAAIAEHLHVYELHACDVPSSGEGSVSASASSSPSPPSSSPASLLELHQRGHVFHVGCGIVALLALANQCVLMWTRDQEVIVVRYQANLSSALTDPRVDNSSRVYQPNGEPSPVHYKEQHWYVVHRLRLWCPDACVPEHPPQLGVNDSIEMVHLRFCSGHVFLISIKWESSCVPGAVPPLPGQRTLRTTRWHTADYMHMYAGTGFHYPTQSCSAATRRPGESAAAHQHRIEQLWRSGSAFANVPDEDLIATHAVMELAKRKNGESAGGGAPNALAPRSADWTGVRAITVRRETYAAPSPLMPSPSLYCGTPQGGFTNVRTHAGQAAVHHAPMDLFVSRSIAVKDDHAAERFAAFAVASPRRAGRRGLDWTLLAFVTSTSHTAVFHLQRPRTPLGTPHYVLDGIFCGSLRVKQVLFCVHSGDASNDVWVVLDSGAVTRFAIAELRARGTEAQNVQRAPLYPWPVTAIAGLPPSFLCRRILPADDLFGLSRESDVWTGGSTASTGRSSSGGGASGAAGAAAAGVNTGVKCGSLSAYPWVRRYALLSDCVQDVYVVDLVARRVVAAITGDGPMTDVCEAPHGYVAAFARGMLRYFQPGMQLHVRGSVRLPPLGVPIHALYATRLGQAVVVERGRVRGAEMRQGQHASAVLEAGVYVMVTTSHTSQLYRVVDARMSACGADAWAYDTNAQTLAFEAVADPTDTTPAAAGSISATTVTLVQCTPQQCRIGAVVHALPSPLVRAVVTPVPGVGAACVGAFVDASLAGTHLALVDGDGVSMVDVVTATGVVLALPVSLAARAVGDLALEVLVGRWDGAVTVLELHKTTVRTKAATGTTAPPTASGDMRGTWCCVASQTIQVGFGTASPVQQFLPLPLAGRMRRWMAAHSSGEVSILALDRRPAESGERQLVYSWVPTSPPYRRAQQKLTCALAPLVRAAGAAARPRSRDNTTNEKAEEEEAGGAVYNGFDGALLQPRDGALLFFSVPLEEGDTEAPPHMQRLRGSDEEDRDWVVRLENTVRGIVPDDTRSRIRTAPWRCAVLIESITPAGELRYDALVVQHDEVTLCTLEAHLFTAAYSRPPASPVSPTAAAPPPPVPPRRAFALACTAPSRYICIHRLQLPQLNPHETLISIAREPDDEGEGVLLCVTVCEQSSLTRLTTLHSGTLAVLESLVLPNSIAQWMSAVPPNTPVIARTAPLFLMCSENTEDGSVQLQVVAAHALRIASSETLEDSLGWLDVSSHEAKIDGAVQVVPTRVTSEGDTYGGEVLVAVAVDHAIHLFVLRGYTLLFQHCVLAPACTSSVTLCYPIVSVCTEGDSNVYLQVYPVNDDTEVLAPTYSPETTRPLKQYGRVSWKMRVSMREPTFGARVLAQAPLYDRCVRTDVEGDVTVMFINLASASAHNRHRNAAHAKGEDAYVGSAEGPQTFLTHTVRLPAVPLKARVLRHVSPIQRRNPRQLQCSGHNYHLQSSSVRKDLSSRLVLLPCHDGSLYGAFEIPYGFAHPLMRLEQVITDAYALDLSVDMNPSKPGQLRHTYHLQPFHVSRALQPLIGTRQAEKQACVMVDAVFEYYLLKDLVQHGYAAPSSVGGVDGSAVASESDTAVVQRKFAALDDVVQTLLTEEYGSEATVDVCAEMLNIL